MTTTTKTAYGFGTYVQWTQDEAIERVVDALKTEGFGILTRIDVDNVLKEKINVEREPYVILGACNPSLANKAINAEPEIGLLLPCNVVVRQDEGKTHVSVMDPSAALGLTENADITPLAGEVREKLERVIASLSS